MSKKLPTICLGVLSKRGVKVSKAFSLSDSISVVDSCCGCGACAASCPVGAIKMVSENAGFSYPAIDSSICIHCGRCDAACPRLHPRDTDQLLSAYWAKSNNLEEILRSSSGGLFALLAHHVFAAGGLVVGASWSKDYSAIEHTIATTESDLDSLMRSKYVQSHIDRNVYKGIKDAVSTGTQVLFVGTACQVSAVTAFLGDLAKTDSFLAVEVICHGVPSPLLWSNWISSVKNRHPDSRLTNINMRQKSAGWVSFSIEYNFEKHSDCSAYAEVVPIAQDWYMKAFLSNASLRPSCFSCTAKRSCGADITLGDYWGINAIHPDIDSRNGVSLVACNTQKGLAAFNSIADKLECGLTDLKKAIVYNPCLVESVAPYQDSEKFLDDLEKGASIADLMDRYPFSRSFKQRAYGFLGAIKRRLLGK